MKTFNIYLLNQIWLIEATIEANSIIEALRKWYFHINRQAGNFRDFQYEAKEVANGEQVLVVNRKGKIVAEMFHKF
jgi:hypothetical protein